jgi:hypothetical protein
MKQLIEDLISAMEYHVEQTRPVHMTTVAIQAAKDALKAMPTHLACDCNQGQVCGVCDPITSPAAQPAVPDAIGPNEDELPAYAAGWNDCRAEMLKGMKP